MNKYQDTKIYARTVAVKEGQIILGDIAVFEIYGDEMPTEPLTEEITQAATQESTKSQMTQEVTIPPSTIEVSTEIVTKPSEPSSELLTEEVTDPAEEATKPNLTEPETNLPTESEPNSTEPESNLQTESKSVPTEIQTEAPTEMTQAPSQTTVPFTKPNVEMQSVDKPKASIFSAIMPKTGEQDAMKTVALFGIISLSILFVFLISKRRKK